MASSSQLHNESAKWTKSEVDVYVMLMVDEMKKGNRTSSTFKKAGWNNIKTQFQARTGHKYTMMQFRNKMNKLRQDYNNFKNLLETPGFSWNSLNRTCTVDNEDLWDMHIKANPHWAKFKKFGLPQWPELQMIFGGTHANGDVAVFHSEDVPNTDDEDDGDDEDVDLTSLTTPLLDGLDDIDGREPAENPQSETHRHDRTSSAKRRSRCRSRSRSRSRSGGRISDFSMACKTITDLFRARMEKINITSSSSPHDHPYSIGKCMDTLSTLEVGDDEYVKAVKRIMDDPNWREAFMHCPPERKNALLRLLD